MEKSNKIIILENKVQTHKIAIKVMVLEMINKINRIKIIMELANHNLMVGMDKNNNYMVLITLIIEIISNNNKMVIMILILLVKMMQEHNHLLKRMEAIIIIIITTITTLMLRIKKVFLLQKEIMIIH